MLAWLTHILPGELWKPVYGLCGLRCVRRLRGQVRIPCHSTRSHKRDVSPCVRWSLLRESNVVVLRDGFEPTTCCFNRLLLYQLSYRNIEAARETRGRKMPVKPWEEAFWGIRFGDCVASGAPLCAVPLIEIIPYTPLKSHICGIST